MQSRPMAPLELTVTAYPLPLLFAAATIFLLGVVGIAHQRISTVTVSFFVLTVCATVWLGSVALLMMADSATTAVVFGRASYFGVCMIPAAVLQFAYALIGQLRKKQLLVAASWAVSALFLLLFTTTDIFITGVYAYSWGHYTRLAPRTVIFVAYFGAVLLTSAVALLRSVPPDATRQQRRRADAFLAALTIGYLASVDFLPSFGIDVYPYGFMAVLGFCLLSIYAIRSFDFVDLSPSFVAEHLIESVQGGVIVVDMKGVVRVANPAAATILASRSEKLIGANLRSVLATTTLPASDSQTLTRAGRARDRVMKWRRADGTSVEVSVSATMLRDREALPVGVLYVVHDLTERRRAERHEFAANHDALTGLPNRAYVTARFEKAADENAARGRTTAVMFLDLDRFKEVNDTHGHAAGDRVLQLAAARLRNALRDDDIIARYGGDEFVVVLSLRAESDAPIVARKLSSVLEEPFLVERDTVRIGVSIGVAFAPADRAELDDLIQLADQAMYDAKRQRPPEPRRDVIAPSPLVEEGRA